MAAIGLLVAGAVVWSAIPNRTTGVISACFLKEPGNHTIRVIDPSKGGRCRSDEASLSWNSRVPTPTRVETFSDPIGPGEFEQVIARCPAGTHVVGGGATRFGGDPRTIRITQNFPSDLAEGWQVEAFNAGGPGAPSFQQRATALCL